eukprot:TRINITY_DN3064_c0_g1_i1.p1 TRINITY_DN3064_c0_g1~~TRINITY_DN3064_c0_g1_i1.p1  ORF type:complete len:790 (+),score=125.17 TRINITY_DN3064_c0_g1_i1:2276-4645(+)
MLAAGPRAMLRHVARGLGRSVPCTQTRGAATPGALAAAFAAAGGAVKPRPAAVQHVRQGEVRLVDLTAEEILHTYTSRGARLVSELTAAVGSLPDLDNAQAEAVAEMYRKCVLAAPGKPAVAAALHAAVGSFSDVVARPDAVAEFLVACALAHCLPPQVRARVEGAFDATAAALLQAGSAFTDTLTLHTVARLCSAFSRFDQRLARPHTASLLILLASDAQAAHLPSAAPRDIATTAWSYGALLGPRAGHVRAHAATLIKGLAGEGARRAAEFRPFDLVSLVRGVGKARCVGTREGTALVSAVSATVASALGDPAARTWHPRLGVNDFTTDGLVGMVFAVASAPRDAADGLYRTVASVYVDAPNRFRPNEVAQLLVGLARAAAVEHMEGVYTAAGAQLSPSELAALPMGAVALAVEACVLALTEPSGPRGAFTLLDAAMAEVARREARDLKVREIAFAARALHYKAGDGYDSNALARNLARAASESLLERGEDPRGLVHALTHLTKLEALMGRQGGALVEAAAKYLLAKGRLDGLMLPDLARLLHVCAAVRPAAEAGVEMHAADVLCGRALSAVVGKLDDAAPMETLVLLANAVQRVNPTSMVRRYNAAAAEHPRAAAWTAIGAVAERRVGTADEVMLAKVLGAMSRRQPEHAHRGFVSAMAAHFTAAVEADSTYFTTRSPGWSEVAAMFAALKHPVPIIYTAAAAAVLALPPSVFRPVERKRLLEAFLNAKHPAPEACRQLCVAALPSLRDVPLEGLQEYVELFAAVEGCPEECFAALEAEAARRLGE